MHASPQPNAAGWNNTDTTVTFEASDAFSGFAGSATEQVMFTTEGADQVASASFTDLAGNTATASATVNIDKTAPVLLGLPVACELSPPNHEMVDVATLRGVDGLSGVAGLAVTATSDEPDDGLGDGDASPDIAVDGGQVRLRAERSGTGRGRTYTISASATDVAGNVARGSATCFVPHNVLPR